MTDSLRDRLNQIQTYHDFFQLRQNLASRLDQNLFDELFQIAISGRDGQAPYMAGCVLIELQPDSPYDLKRLMQLIHESKWFVSFKEIPFYLISQFGKHAVLNDASEFLQALSSDEAGHSRVKTIPYWASMPASDLCKPFHEWEFESYNDAPSA